jgi:hypothetical protein
METKFISMSYLRESTKIKAMLRLQCWTSIMLKIKDTEMLPVKNNSLIKRLLLYIWVFRLLSHLPITVPHVRSSLFLHHVPNTRMKLGIFFYYCLLNKAASNYTTWQRMVGWQTNVVA